MTLHTITQETRAILKWTAITISIFLLIIILFRVGSNIKEYFFPTPLPPPTVSFGKLPAFSFPKNATDKKLVYTINTVSGVLPVFKDRATVYPILQPTPNLLSLKRTQSTVAQVGFTIDGTAISETLYQWSENKTPFRILNFDIVSSNFTLSSNYLTNSTLLSAKNFPNENTATNIAKNFLDRMSLFPDDIDLAKTKTTFLTVDSGQLIAATSPSTASVVRVDLFQKDVNSLPIYYPQTPYSTMNFFITGGEFEPQIIQAAFTHFSINDESSTYPIKTTQQAFTELQEGKTYIASYFGNSNSVQIKNVSLAYYLGDTAQDYLMPIVVFEGDNGFFAYIPAVTSEWIGK